MCSQGHVTSLVATKHWLSGPAQSRLECEQAWSRAWFTHATYTAGTAGFLQPLLQASLWHASHADWLVSICVQAEAHVAGHSEEEGLGHAGPD